MTNPVALEYVRYVFLDRDGVINEKLPEGLYVRNWRDMHILPGVERAIAALNRSGRKVIVVTNQRGIALGLYTERDLDTIHQKLQKHLEAFGAHIDNFYYCPHDVDQCSCRKPQTGLFTRAFEEFPDASASNSLVVGDSEVDIQAAKALGIASVFIQGDPRTQKAGAHRATEFANLVCRSLRELVDEYFQLKS